MISFFQKDWIQRWKQDTQKTAALLDRYQQTNDLELSIACSCQSNLVTAATAVCSGQRTAGKKHCHTSLIISYPHFNGNHNQKSRQCNDIHYPYQHEYGASPVIRSSAHSSTPPLSNSKLPNQSNKRIHCYGRLSIRTCSRTAHRLFDCARSLLGSLFGLEESSLFGDDSSLHDVSRLNLVM